MPQPSLLEEMCYQRSTGTAMSKDSTTTKKEPISQLYPCKTNTTAITNASNYQSSSSSSESTTSGVTSGSSSVSPSSESNSIPIGHHIRRTESEIQLQEDKVMADYRDYCMYQRIVSGMMKNQERHQKLQSTPKFFDHRRIRPIHHHHRQQQHQHQRQRQNPNEDNDVTIQSIIRTRHTPVSSFLEEEGSCTGHCVTNEGRTDDNNDSNNGHYRQQPSSSSSSFLPEIDFEDIFVMEW